jgi:hypothetical protein
MKNRWCLLPIALFQMACATQVSELRFHQTWAKEVAGPPSATKVAVAVAREQTATLSAKEIAQTQAALLDCELRLYIEQDHSEGTYGVPDQHLGVAVVERLPNVSQSDAPVQPQPTSDAKEPPIPVRDGVCIKRKDRPLELPATVLVTGVDQGYLERFCVDEERMSTVRISVENKEPMHACAWNGAFHASKPFSFTLVTAKEEQVADYVELVRVYRNGDLMAAWNRASDQIKKYEVKIEGNPLRSGFWSATIPPHLAAMDLRIVPRGSPVGDAVFLKVRDDNSRFLKRASEALKAGADEALPKDSPARKSLNCLKKRILHGKAQVLKVVRGEIPVPQLDDEKCEMPLGLEYGTPLSDAYEKSKHVTREELARLKERTETELEKAQDKLEAKLPEEARKALEEGAKALYDAASEKVREAVAKRLDTPPKLTLVAFLEKEREALGLPETEIKNLNGLYDTFLKLSKDVDAQIASALRSVDEARALALDLYEEARRIGTDTERQAQIFSAMVTNLQTQEDVFEARRDNPPLLAGEQKLAMEYSDTFQTFLLAPWNGVPIRVGSDAEADLNAAVAVPLLDVFGFRVQWAKSRFADFRVAAGIGYTATERVNEDGSEQSKSTFLPNVSVGLGTFKVGFGAVTASAGPKFHDRLRVIVGADLLKLISGSNVEAF